MPPAHRNVEIATITASVMKGVSHACRGDGLTTSVATGTGVRAFDLTGSMRAVARVRFRLASASVARSSSIVAPAARWPAATPALAAGFAWPVLPLLASTPIGCDLADGGDAVSLFLVSTMAVVGEREYR